MKYLSETMSLEEAKKVYRRLAKTLHPDVGGDEDEFKILSAEYTAIERRAAEPQFTLMDIEDVLRVAESRVNVIVGALQELYPRTPVQLHYSPMAIDAVFTNTTPLSKMVHIESIINDFKYPFSVTCKFKRGESSKRYDFFTKDGHTYINMARGEVPNLSDAKSIYEGRRYRIVQNRRYTQCVDSKTSHTYTMRRTPKFNLKELMGL